MSSVAKETLINPFGILVSTFSSNFLPAGKTGWSNRSGSCGKPGAKLPKIFYVNWFLKNEQGKFMWPGFGDNSRVLKWVFERVAGKTDAVETPIGYVPEPGAIDIEGLDIDKATMDKLLAVHPEKWLEDVASIRKHYAQFGSKLPATLTEELEALIGRLEKSAAA